MVTSIHVSFSGLYVGAVCWGVFGVVAWAVAQLFFVKETPKCTRAESKELATLVVVTSTICMGCFWAFVYMHQMNPLIYPSHTAR